MLVLLGVVLLGVEDVVTVLLGTARVGVVVGVTTAGAGVVGVAGGALGTVDAVEVSAGTLIEGELGTALGAASDGVASVGVSAIGVLVLLAGGVVGALPPPPQAVSMAHESNKLAHSKWRDLSVVEVME